MTFAKITTLCVLALSTIAVSVPYNADQYSTYNPPTPPPVNPPYNPAPAVTPAKVILYQDYGLQGSTKNLDAAPNQCIDINDFNDVVSSFQVYQPSGEQTCVVAYDDYGCNGPEQLLCGVGDVQRNDIISSIRFETPLIRATFYEDFTHSGRKISARVTPGQCTNLREMNDAVSSFEISNVPSNTQACVIGYEHYNCQGKSEKLCGKADIKANDVLSSFAYTTETA